MAIKRRSLHLPAVKIRRDLLPAILRQRIGAVERYAVPFDRNANLLAKRTGLSISGAARMKVDYVSLFGQTDSPLQRPQRFVGGTGIRVVAAMAIDMQLGGWRRAGEQAEGEEECERFRGVHDRGDGPKGAAGKAKAGT
ncbi:hypothetical protein C5Y97_29845 [Blastopirellula marina]|uniref:Uncharacterized protein n=1 Tax=Blastopirellula marina TaxID=124 RepID=A0A2S8F3S0_9BACT|nr:hypothetical protein C5Y98_29830 [Blastopirellula marina]PTL40895.1 hypothetical protein C5Y97_29845 [Blastopirellula marina]